MLQWFSYNKYTLCNFALSKFLRKLELVKMIKYFLGFPGEHIQIKIHYTVSPTREYQSIQGRHLAYPKPLFIFRCVTASRLHTSDNTELLV